MIMCVRVWLLLLMTLCYKNKEFQLPAVQFFIYQSPSCYMPLGQMSVKCLYKPIVLLLYKIFSIERKE